MGISQNPRIAFIDIETAPLIIAAWQTYDTNAIWVVRNTFILSFAVQWEGEEDIKFFGLPNYIGYKKDKHNDKKLCQDLWGILDQADIVIAHNGDGFDIKRICARLAFHGHQPPSPFKSIDTLKLARKHFKFDSNKLDHLAQYLGIGRKLPHTGKDLWRDCENGNTDAWEMMENYNKHDVWLLKPVFEKLKAWGNLPDLRPYSSASEHSCPTCLSNHIQRRGFNIARSRKYPRFHCQNCGKWFSGKKAESEKVAA